MLTLKYLQMLHKLHIHYTNVPSTGSKPRFSLLPFVLEVKPLAEEKRANENTKECVAKLLHREVASGSHKIHIPRNCALQIRSAVKTQNE